MFNPRIELTGGGLSNRFFSYPKLHGEAALREIHVARESSYASYTEDEKAKIRAALAKDARAMLESPEFESADGPDESLIAELVADFIDRQ